MTVHIFHGLTYYASDGLDALAKALPGTQIHPWQEKNPILGVGPIILIGHSQGANTCIEIANRLAPSRVALLATICPVYYFGRPRIGYNVDRCINFTTSIWGSYLEPGPGAFQPENYDIKGWHVFADSDKHVLDTITSEARRILNVQL